MRQENRKEQQQENGRNARQENPGREEAEAVIREHAAGLKEELNLRLLCREKEEDMEDRILLEMLRQAGRAALWGELCTSENILWVDEVLITEIAYSCDGWKRKVKKNGFLSWLKRFFSCAMEHLHFRNLFADRGQRKRNQTRY